MIIINFLLFREIFHYDDVITDFPKSKPQVGLFSGVARQPSNHSARQQGYTSLANEESFLYGRLAYESQLWRHHDEKFHEITRN